MRKNRNTAYDKCLVTAQQTIDLVNHKQTPDQVSDAVLETLIDMSAKSRIMIWAEKTGLRVESLAALYSLYERGAGYRRSRLYGDYEYGRTRRNKE